MALHKDFPESPHAILDPTLRWFPADEALCETSMEKLMPPLVPQLRKKVQEFRDGGYVGAADTSRSLLHWWFNTPHLLPQADGTMAEFQYYFAQREALETVIYLYDVVGTRDKFDLMRFDSSGVVSAGMFDETWRRFVVKMATGSGKTKVLDRIYKDFQGLRIFCEDPVRILLKADGSFEDLWNDKSYFVDYGPAEVVVVHEIRMYDAGGTLLGYLAGASDYGIKYAIILNEYRVIGATLAHEVGHSCDLDDLDDSTELHRVMYEKVGGNSNLLTLSEASAFE